MNVKSKLKPQPNPKPVPQGHLSLVDNRIVLGVSTWALKQPITICVLHPKQTKDEHRALVQGMLALLNEFRRAPISKVTES